MWQSCALRSTYVAEAKAQEVNEKSTPKPPVRSVMREEFSTLNSELSTRLAHSIARLSLYCAVGSDEHCSIERCGG